MTDETDSVSEVARVLGEHSHYAPDARTQEELDGSNWECADCGHTFDVMFDDDPTRAMAAHQAAMLAEAGLLREEHSNALAWDRGYTWGRNNSQNETETANPYRAQIATQETAERTQGGSGDSRASGGLDGAPVDAWPFQRGAVLEWPEDPQTVIDALEDAPVGVHVSDRYSNPWRRFPKGWAAPKSTSDGSNAPSSYLAGRAPITVTALTDTEITP